MFKLDLTWTANENDHAHIFLIICRYLYLLVQLLFHAFCFVYLLSNVPRARGSPVDAASLFLQRHHHHQPHERTLPSSSSVVRRRGTQGKSRARESTWLRAWKKHVPGLATLRQIGSFLRDDDDGHGKQKFALATWLLSGSF